MRIAVGLLLMCGRDAFALNPDHDVTQYAHTAWRVRDGFTKGPILAIAQTPDGYLWLGTELGLLRFDGVRTVAWEPPRGQQLPSNDIWGLLASRDGSLWIGTSRGLARWRDGTLTHVAQFDGHYVYALREDREGTVWAGSIKLNDAKLCAIGRSGVECYGGGGKFGNTVLAVFEDSAGGIWASVSNGLWRCKPGPPAFHPVAESQGNIQSFVDAEGGGFLVTAREGFLRIVDGKTEPYTLPGSTGKVLFPQRLLRDRDGSLWIGTVGQGLLRAHHGRTDVFTRTDGLSGDSIRAIFEDREGNVWIATSNGLDRFRDIAVPTLGARQGASNASATSVLATSDGSIWFGANATLNRWSGEQVTTVPNIAIPNSLLLDRRGRVWVSTLDGAGYFENGRYLQQRGVPGGNAVRAMTEDTDGNVWIANQRDGLFRVSPAGEVQQISWSTFGRKDFASALIADTAQGGLWVGFYDGGVVYLHDGRIRQSYTVGARPEDQVASLRFDRHGALWVATAGGLSRIRGGRVATLTSRHGLPCDRVHWSIEDDAQSVWLNMPCGLVRVPLAQLDAWSANVDTDGSQTHKVTPTVFDTSDGVGARSEPGGYSPQVVKSADGRIWSASLEGVSVIDPARLPFNRVLPPVHVEQIAADRVTYDLTTAAGGPVRLPPLTRELQISYSALSLVAPEKMQFRYKLEGHDNNWQDVGTRRQAFYTDLPPGNYRFHVIASNNSGVWNESGASLQFAIAPAYYQTLWFRLLVIVALVTLAMAAYQYRIRTVAHQLAMRLEARVEERTRIARDFHDTLLQSFQGVLLKFQAATYLLPNRPDEARKTLEAVIEQASVAISEGRDAVHGLRASTLVTTDLAQAISLLGDQLAADHGGMAPPGLRVEVHGTPRDLAPIVRDEVYRIAGEAMRNAFRHASANRIEVDLHYDPRVFRLHVRDDGKGIDPAVLAAGGRTQHFGLRGMHERAHLVAGKLAVWSELLSGCEIELTIPASVAYAKSSRAS